MQMEESALERELKLRRRRNMSAGRSRAHDSEDDPLLQTVCQFLKKLLYFNEVGTNLLVRNFLFLRNR